MADKKPDPPPNENETESLGSRSKMFVDQYIFPGKLFPCYRNRVGEDGEVLPPPTLSELLRFEADNAKGIWMCRY